MRGLAIILVVMGHANRGALDAFGPRQFLIDLDFIIYVVQIPAFLYLAGYFTQLVLRHNDKIAYLRKRIGTNIYSYVIWSVIYVTLSLAMRTFTQINHPLYLADLAAIAWHPINILWFLYALCILQLFGLLLCTNGRAYLVLAIIFDALLWVMGSDSHNIVCRTIVHSPYFALGFFRSQIDRPAIPKMRSANIILVFGIFCVGCLAMLVMRAEEPVTFVMLPVGLAGVAAMAGIASRLDRLSSRWIFMLSAVGKASMGIYLLHALILALVPRGLRLIGLFFPGTLIVIGTISATLGAYILYLCLRRVGYSRMLGLG